MLHDIGKIGVPDAILLEPGPLTERETRIMQMHTTRGEHLLAFVPLVSDLVHDVVAYHHERWDGSGYHWELSGREIPLDAITNDRPYRKARPVATAVAEASEVLDHSSILRWCPAFVTLACQFGTDLSS